MTLLPGAVACQSRPVMGGRPEMPPVRTAETPPDLSVETVATGLEVVWGMVFTPDGRMLFTERPGRIRALQPDGRLDAAPWKTLSGVHHEGEGGLMGIALHPEFPEQPWVYVMYTADAPGGAVNRISRIREVDGRGAGEEIVLDGLPAGSNHNGGRIRFGPDGLLYIGAGEIWQRNRAQDLNDPAGSVLRVTPDGGIPADNPFPGSPIFSYGHRNVQGITWDPRTGALLTAEHGPSGEWPGVGGHDEINVTLKGRNYGWPLAVGAPGEPGLEDPILVWPSGAPPGDLLFHPGDGPPGLGGYLFFSTLRSECLYRIGFGEPDRPEHPTSLDRWFVTPEGRSVYGRLRALAVGPDGALYIGTSNRSRGAPREGDDRILRLAPARTGEP